MNWRLEVAHMLKALSSFAPHTKEKAEAVSSLACSSQTFPFSEEHSCFLHSTLHFSVCSDSYPGEMTRLRCYFRCVLQDLSSSGFHAILGTSFFLIWRVFFLCLFGFVLLLFLLFKQDPII